MSLRPKSAWRGAACVGAALALTLTACAEDPAPTTPSITEYSGTLKIGTILPTTGNLAFLGPPEFAGVDLAIKEINEAGGVWGNPVSISHKDSGDTSTDIATQSAEAHIQAGVHGVIGAASSGVSLTFLERLYNNKIIQISPANTSPVFTEHEFGKYYFRTAPSDVLQGRVLADLAIADGHETLAIVALQDAYGTGLLQYTKLPYEAQGGKVVAEIVYDPTLSDFSDVVAQVAAADPDAIALITFDEIKTLAPQLANANLGPSVKPWYFVDGNLANYDQDLPAGLLEGVKGTLPGAAAGDEFRQRLFTVDPDLDEFAYAPESYDATILLALAAVKANSEDPDAIAAALVDVSKGGTKCTTFAQCKELLLQGVDIDYDGVSGPVEWSDAGDPTAATIGIYQYGPDNRYSPLEYRDGVI